ncbi:MAG: hypothetical protein Q8L04_00340, partial [Ignavibacteria bacterium]|nr:hypothetical protein [Ignavibacteria bacterium]
IKNKFPLFYLPAVNRLFKGDPLFKVGLSIDNPFYIYGDFNNDNIVDYALIIARNYPINHSGGWWIGHRVLILNGNSDSTFTEFLFPPEKLLSYGSVIENPYRREIYIALTKLHSGINKVKNEYSEISVNLKHSAIGIISAGDKSIYYYYYKGNRYIEKYIYQEDI